MPFTFAHPAIVLPGGYLPKQWVSLTGLVVGSLTPDFEYFFRWQVLSIYSHTLAGIIWFDVPVALALSFIFHIVIKKALLENLPAYFKGRFLKFKNFDWVGYFKTHFVVVVLSIIIGVFSHIIWDSFTHEHGWFVEKLSFLTHQIFFNNISIPVFKLLQHSSSVTGIILILYIIIQLPKENTSKNNYQPQYWLLVVALTSLFMGIRCILDLDIKQIGNVVVSFISAGLLSVCITPFLLKIFKFKKSG